MALHPDITRKDDVSLALETAVDALLLATTQQTSNAGSVTIQNADGTKTLMGADAGDTTVAKFVGDTTAPGKPTGITALSHMRTVFVNWDGSLDGGVPKDFLLVRLHLSYAGEDGAAVESDLGDLYGPGGAASVSFPEGTVVTVTARAYDDAHDASGLSRPNVSDSCDPITVTVVDDAAELQRKVEADIKVVSDKADEAHGVADDAAAANTKLREDTAKSLETVNTAVSGVRTDVDAVSKKATTLASGLDSANTKITSTSDKLTGLTTTVSNVSKTADDSMALSTTNHQDLAGFKTTVQQTYSTKQDTLNQVTTVDQKADALSATLSKDYQKTADSDAKYSTKAELTATSNSITTSVAEIYATKSVVEALKNIADKAIETWQGPGEPTLTNLPASDWTTADLKKQHSGDVYYDTDSGFAYRFGSADGTTYKWGRISDSDITKALNLASKAQETADGAVAGVTKLNTDIPLTYASKSEVKVTTDGIKADVVEAKRIGQTGVDNAAALAIRADGIDATLSQQASNIDKNVKSIAQVNMRADSLSTSISQVSTKTDLALANAQELVVNGDFHTGDATGWSSRFNTSYSFGVYNGLKRIQMNLSNTSYSAMRQESRPVIVGHTYRLTATCYIDFLDNDSLVLGLRTSDSTLLVRAAQLTVQQSWTTITGDITITSDMVADVNNPSMWVEVWADATTHDNAPRALFSYASFKDITEAKAAQKAADDAQSTANTAVSQTSTLSQDLSGFKTSVGQTYETKTDSTAKNTALQQNLDGFKTSVESTYASKSDVANTYATKSDVTQTSDSLTSQISAVGTDATSALNKATTNQQNLDGFKTSVSSTYATKQALGDTDGKAVKAGNNANLALANAQNMVMNTGNDLNNTSVNNGVTAENGVYTRTFPGNENHVDFLQGNLAGKAIPGHTYSISFDARVDSGNYVSDDFFNFVWSHGWHGVMAQPLSGDWQRFASKTTVGGNGTDAPLFFMSSYMSSDGAKVVQFRNLSIKDVTEVAQLQSDVAATYATQSSVQQTSSQITQQVAATYATKDDVTSKYTTLQQTDSAFDARIGTAQSTAANAQSNASNAQNRAGVIETLIHSDANGVRVGKTVNDSYAGYSALVNANGSFDVLDPGGNTMSRVNSDGMQLLNPLTGSLMNANRMIFGGLSVIETNVLNTDPTNIPSGGGLTPWKDFGSLRNPDGSLAQIMSPTGKLLCLLSVVDEVSATSSTVANGSDVRSIALNVNLTLGPQTGSTTGGQPTDVWNPVPAIVDLPNAGQSYYPESRPFVGLLNVSPNTIYYPHFSLRSVHSTAGSHYAQCGYRSLVLLPIT